MTKIVVCGVAGRMGTRLANLVLDSEALELTGATERPGPEAVGKDAGVVAGRPEDKPATLSRILDCLPYGIFRNLRGAGIRIFLELSQDKIVDSI